MDKAPEFIWEIIYSMNQAITKLEDEGLDGNADFIRHMRDELADRWDIS